MIGPKPNQVPFNSSLGELAYSDFEEVKKLGSFPKVLTTVERGLYQARLGEIVYDSDKEELYFYSASGWKKIS